MTIIRLINRASKLLRPALIHIETCSRQQICRNASILATNFTEKRPITGINSQLQTQFVRNKKSSHKKPRRDDSSDDESDEEEEEDLVQDKHSKTMKVVVNSMRLDLIIKSGLGLARNKVEALFYDSRIRVNGQKVDKKSARVDIGDEIDVIKGLSHQNPEHLVIQRVEILSAKPKEEQDGLIVKLRRNKSLTIENYEDPFKGNVEE
ncbi:mitochondrial transcription rescue factor 1 [Culicoides brevitarsis]|uniref:mitochondrial transcription rescue factor 1 n=1 Tax=Culicoides brevitarsis TaxID=469753 RepID=UPI00307C3D9E